jgi:hypothetical protein
MPIYKESCNKFEKSSVGFGDSKTNSNCQQSTSSWKSVPKSDSVVQKDAVEKKDAWGSTFKNEKHFKDMHFA